MMRKMRSNISIEIVENVIIPLVLVKGNRDPAMR